MRAYHKCASMYSLEVLHSIGRRRRFFWNAPEKFTMAYIALYSGHEMWYVEP